MVGSSQINLICPCVTTDVMFSGQRFAILAMFFFYMKQNMMSKISDFWIAPVKSGFPTLQIYPRVYWNMFIVKPGGKSVPYILHCFNPKVWQTVESPLCLSEKFPSDHQTFPWGCAPREILVTLGNSLWQIFPDNYYILSTVCTIVSISFYSAGIPLQFISEKFNFSQTAFIHKCCINISAVHYAPLCF